MSFTYTSRLQGTYTRFVVERGPHWSSAVFSYAVHLQTDRQIEEMARLLQKYWVTYIPYTLTHLLGLCTSPWTAYTLYSVCEYVLFNNSQHACFVMVGSLYHTVSWDCNLYFHCLTSHCTKCCRHSIPMVACKQRKIM